MTTLVSAFVSNINSRDDMNIQKYYHNGRLFLKSTAPKVVFLDEPMLELIGEDYDKTTTLLIKINREDNYLYQYKHLITKFTLNADTTKKDTLDYMFSMCNKTEWLKTAIDLNHFNTDNFTWVDFGIRYICHCTDDEFIQKLDNLQNKVYQELRLGKIWDLNRISKRTDEIYVFGDVEHFQNYDHFKDNTEWAFNIYETIAWAFAGGIIGGSKDKLLLFADKMRTKCIEIIHTRNTIMWETNIWYLIYVDNKELFNPYPGDHNNSLLDNY